MKRNEEYVQGEKLANIFFRMGGRNFEICELLGKAQKPYSGDPLVPSYVVGAEPWVVVCGNDWYKFLLLKRASFEETDYEGESL